MGRRRKRIERFLHCQARSVRVQIDLDLAKNEDVDATSIG